MIDRRNLRLGLAALIVCVASGALHAQEITRQEVLKLNDLPGEGLIAERVASLKKDGDMAKRYLAAATPIAQEEKSPIGYVAAYVLGSLAREQKDVAAAQRFYRICIDKARMLHSDRKLALGYLETLCVLQESKQPDQAAKVLEEFLAVPMEEEEVDDVIIDGDAVLLTAIDVLAKDSDFADKLVQLALKQVKDGKKPNATAAYVLAFVGQQIKKVDASRDLFRYSLDRAEAVLAEQIKQYQAAEGRVEEDDLLRSDRKVAILYMDLIDLLYENKRFDEAEKFSKEILEKRGGNTVAKRHALLRIIQAMAAQGRLEDAFKQLQPLVKAAPDDPEVLQIQAWLTWQAERYGEAARLYEKIMAASEDDDAKDRIAYRLSHLYTESGEIDKAIGKLQGLLKKDPNSATYNNDLGYLMADHDRDLVEAEKHVQKALDKDPESGAYLDSMAWVLYKKGSHKEAKALMEKAIKDPDSQHAEIYDHLGDIHWKLGEKADAISAWKKAVELAGTGKRDVKRKAELEKKLKENQ